MKESFNMTPSPEAEKRREKIRRRGAMLLGMKLFMAGLSAASAAEGDANKTDRDMDLEHGGDQGTKLTLENFRSMTFEDVVASLDTGPDPEMPDVPEPGDVELKDVDPNEGGIERKRLSDLGDIDLDNANIVDEGDCYTIEIDMEKLMEADEADLELKKNANVEDPNEKVLRQVEAKEAAEQKRLKEQSGGSTMAFK